MIIEQELSYPILSTSTSKEQDEIQYKSLILKINNNKTMYNVHRALIHQLTNNKQKSANTKTRSDVRGGGKKPWKQKGSGRARAGSSRSPLWKGGGVTFGPQSKKNHSEIKINQKEKQLALRNILYNKFEKTFIIDNFISNLETPKTRDILNILKSINIPLDNKILIILHRKHYNFYLSTRNLPNIQVIYANQLNIFALLQANILLITSDAIDIIQTTYNGEKQ